MKLEIEGTHNINAFTFSLAFAYQTMKHGLENTCLLHIQTVSNKASIDFWCFSASL